MRGATYTTGRAYRIPEKTLPGHTNAVLLDRLNGLIAWCEELGIRTSGTRLARYRRYLEKPPDLHGPLDRGVFLDPPESPIQHALDRYLYVLREVHELGWISQGLRRAEVKGVTAKLIEVVGGADFAALDRNNTSRNTQFELRIASYFARAGFRLDLSTLTDVVAVRGRTAYHVECKRIGSERQLDRRLREAAAQLRRRTQQGIPVRGHACLVAADVTKVGFRRNGLTMGHTPEHSRDVVREAISAIAGQLDLSRSVELRPACALWLQIHIPSWVMHPPTPVTHFTNLILANPRGSRLRRQSDRFWRLFTTIDTHDPGDQPSEPLQIRADLRVPEGTLFGPDLDLLEHIVATGAPPLRPADHVVLSILPPGGKEADWLDFSYAEFRMMFDALSPDDRAAFRSPMDATRSLIGRLLLQRFPYRGNPPWLD